MNQVFASLSRIDICVILKLMLRFTILYWLYNNEFHINFCLAKKFQTWSAGYFWNIIQKTWNKVMQNALSWSLLSINKFINKLKKNTYHFLQMQNVQTTTNKYFFKKYITFSKDYYLPNKIQVCKTNIFVWPDNTMEFLFYYLSRQQLYQNIKF